MSTANEPRTRALPPATRADGFLLIGMIVAAAVVWFPTSAIAIALPTLQDEFDTSLSELALIPVAYMLALPASSPSSGG